VTFRLSTASYRNLHGVHPSLVDIVVRAIEITEVDFRVIEGVRSPERQRELVRLGRSQTMRSRHLIHPDGFGHAVDLMAVGDLNDDGKVDHQDRAITWSRVWYTKIAAAMFTAAGELGHRITWGGGWKTFYDGPHFQLEQG